MHFSRLLNIMSVKNCQVASNWRLCIAKNYFNAFAVKVGDNPSFLKLNLPRDSNSDAQFFYGRALELAAPKRNNSRCSRCRFRCPFVTVNTCRQFSIRL
jgi:hypothetical protein